MSPFRPNRIWLANLKYVGSSERCPSAANEPYRSGQRKYSQKRLLMAKGSKTPSRLAGKGGATSRSRAQYQTNVKTGTKARVTFPLQTPIPWGFFALYLLMLAQTRSHESSLLFACEQSGEGPLKSLGRIPCFPVRAIPPSCHYPLSKHSEGQ